MGLVGPHCAQIDSEAFEIALTAVAQAPDDPEDEEPIPLRATCGAPIGIFPEVTPSTGATSAAQLPPPEPTTPTTPATPPRSRGTSRARPPKSSNQPTAAPSPRCLPAGHGASRVREDLGH